MPKQAYMVVLEGQGDVKVSLVDAETWNWIHRDDSAERQGDSSWNEIDLAPAALREAVKRENLMYKQKYGWADSSPAIQITCGSADNDRAMALTDGGCLFHSFGGYEDIRMAEDWAKDSGYEIVDTYSGYIY